MWLGAGYTLAAIERRILDKRRITVVSAGTNKRVRSLGS
jgi:hypothetical protein